MNLNVPYHFTYVHLNARKREDLAGRHLARRVPVELVQTAVEFHRIQRRPLQVVDAAQRRVLATPDGGRIHLQADVANGGQR